MSRTISKETDAAIAALPIGGRYIYGDGFGIRRTKFGFSRFLRWRMDGSKQFFEVSLGTTSRVDFTEAKREAARLRGRIALGINPIEEKRAAKAARAADAAARMSVNAYAGVYQKNRKALKKPATLRQDALLLGKYILPAIGDMDIRDVGRVHVKKLFDGLATTPTTANRVVARLGHLLAEAASDGYRDAALPRAAVKKHTERPRNRPLSAVEMKRLWKALDKLGEKHRDSRDVLRLLILTGARKHEIMDLRWDAVDFEGKRLNLAGSKTGPRTITLSASAVAVLDARPRTGEWVFARAGVGPAKETDKTGPRASIEKTWRRARTMAKLPDLHVHDLRHAFGSAAAAAGLSLPQIGALLGHRTAVSTERYSRVHADTARAAADIVGQRIDAIVAPLMAVK